MIYSVVILVFVLWLAAAIHAVAGLRRSLALLRCVRTAARPLPGREFRSESAAADSAASGPAGPGRPDARTAKAAVILPCCGVDEKLHETVAALGRQNYPGYSVTFTFESADDPAYPAVGGWTANWKAVSHQRVIAGPTEHRSQKVHNLLAAVDHVPPDADILVFLDADAQPGDDWLRQLAAATKDESVGAATGYRWYRAAGGVAAGVRCVWNAAALPVLTHPRLAFCWGGSTAIRRATFDRIDVRGHWEGALSDDLQLTRAVRDAGLTVRFVPQALTISDDFVRLLDFWRFARRQMIITRICLPEVWRDGFLYCLNQVVGGTAPALLFFADWLLGWPGDPRVRGMAFAGWMGILALAGANVLLRQQAVRTVLRPPRIGWMDLVWELGGVVFSGVLHMMLFTASIGTRRIRWRHLDYEMIGPARTRILRRRTIEGI